MRAFLAFELSSEVVRNILEAQEEIARTGADLSLVGRDNMHLTVKFLGEVPDGIVGEIDRRIAAVHLSSTTAALRGVGAFPDLRRPRVVWAGAAPSDGPKLVERAEAVLAALKGIGQDDDRGYHAHVTLARVRSPRNQEALLDFLKRNSEREFGTTSVAALKLKSSVLTSRGPVYTEIKEYVLK